MEACSAMLLFKIKHEIKYVFFKYWHIIREKIGRLQYRYCVTTIESFSTTFKSLCHPQLISIKCFTLKL